MNIFLDAPQIGEEEKNALIKVAESGFVSSVGPLVNEFEQKFAHYMQQADCVALQSGTAALHMALYELGIGEGDDVIVPATTYVATVNPIRYVGANPIIVDVDSKTWNIDVESLEKAITPRTKAIIPVHLFGNPCDMTAIMKIAAKNNLSVIEDATESLGAKYQGQWTGTIGDLGCFSFNGNKTITSGSGGMVVGKDSDRLKHIRFLINQARENNQAYHHPEIGFNLRMTNVHAALGLAQFSKLDIFLEKKRRIFEIYKEEFNSSDNIVFQESEPNSNSSHWMSVIRFSGGVDIDELQQELKKKNIPTRRIFPSLTEQLPYVPFKTQDCKVADDLYANGLCLPSSVLNSEEDVREVAKEIVLCAKKMCVS